MQAFPLLVLAALAWFWQKSHGLEQANAANAATAKAATVVARKAVARLEAIRTLPPKAVKALATATPLPTFLSYQPPGAVAPTKALTASSTPAQILKAKSTAIARSPERAARDLRGHLADKGSPGSKGAPSGVVRDAQRDMGGLIADGIFGSNTRKRARALGVVIPV